MAIGDKFTLAGDENGDVVDLIYGLKETREVYIKFLGLPTATIDRLNNATLCRLQQIGEESSQLPPKESEYLTFLSQNMPTFQHKPSRPLILSRLSEDDLIKKACKLGVQYVAQQGGRIRFVLDELDLDAIASKETGHGKSFTASELRYFFRHWEMPIGDQGQLKDYVTFYEGLVEVPAPWESAPQVWSQYQAKNTIHSPRIVRSQPTGSTSGEERECVTPPPSLYLIAKHSVEKSDNGRRHSDCGIDSPPRLGSGK